MKHRALLAAAALLAAGVTANAAEYRIETVAEGLEFPWSLAFLPGGDMLVTERAGRLRIIREGRLLPAAVAGVPESYVAGQGGLMEVLPDPDFAENRLIYLSLAHGTREANATRLVRGRLEGDALRDVEVLFTAQPLKATPVHYGGRLAFLADGTLALTLGDGANYREESQKLSSHFGTIVRLNRDGSVPADNPFVGQAGALPEIYSYGHRNVQGIVLDAGSGRLYAHEHGARGGDELNLVRPGINYGWPVITYGVDYSGAQISPYTERPGLEQPLLQWTPSIAPGGLALYDGSLFPDWRGSLFVAALRAKEVRRIPLQDGQPGDQETLFTELNERFRDVRTGPDGALYLLTDSARGRVLRVVPAR